VVEKLGRSIFTAGQEIVELGRDRPEDMSPERYSTLAETLRTYRTVEAGDCLQMVLDEFWFLSSLARVSFVDANEAVEAAGVQKAGNFAVVESSSQHTSPIATHRPSLENAICTLPASCGHERNKLCGSLTSGIVALSEMKRRVTRRGRVSGCRWLGS
jgi:hypothetical protein